MKTVISISLLIYSWTVFILPTYCQQVPVWNFPDACEHFKDSIMDFVTQETGITERIDEKRKTKTPTSLQEIIGYDLIRRFGENEFVCDQEILAYAIEPFQEIIASNPALRQHQLMLNVSKNPTYNASAAGENFVIVNAGLLANIKTKEEYYFILAHELAHNILGHSEALLAIQQELEKQLEEDKINTAVKESVDKQESLIRYLESLHQQQRAFSRTQEYEADSLAMILLHSVLPYPELAIAALQYMEDYKVQEVAWSSILHFKEMPFKQSWITLPQQLTQPDSADIHKIDLFRTHPHAKDRIEKLKKEWTDTLHVQGNDYKLPPQQLNLLNRESVEFLIMQENYADALYYGFLYTQQTTDHSEMCLLMSQLFLKLYTLRLEHTFTDYIPATPVKLSDSHDELICLLNTLRTKELLSIGYHYLMQCPIAKNETFTTLVTTYEKYLNP